MMYFPSGENAMQLTVDGPPSRVYKSANQLEYIDRPVWMVRVSENCDKIYFKIIDSSGKKGRHDK